MQQTADDKSGRDPRAGDAVKNRQRVELRYCERCGVLHTAPHSQEPPAGDPLPVTGSCRACRAAMRWLLGEVQR
jgi:hypothetical protein